MNSPPRFLALLATGFLLSTASAHAESPRLESATITAATDDDQLSIYDSKTQTLRPARVNDTLNGNSECRTGRGCRAELVFNDKSVARIGANTIFSFKPGTREFKLQKGTALLEVPKGYGDTHLITPTATCTLTGTTVLAQHAPSRILPATMNNAYITLEGSMKTVIKDTVTTIPAGSGLNFNSQQKNPGTNKSSAIITDFSTSNEQFASVDLTSIINSSSLIIDFPSLPLGIQNIILAGSKHQADRKNAAKVAFTPGVGVQTSVSKSVFVRTEYSYNFGKTTKNPGFDNTKTTAQQAQNIITAGKAQHNVVRLVVAF